MDLREVVRRRRMVRNYTDEPVDPAVLDEILSLATRAPSAGFSQGQRFVVITDGETRRKIAELAEEESYVEGGMDPWLSRAPVHVVMCVREDDYHERYRESDKVDDAGGEIEWPVPYWWVDAGAAMMLLLLAAVEAGLAAGFFGVHRLPQLKGLLDIPDDVSPIGVVTIGHPANDRRSGSLKRGWRAKDQVVHRERWSG
jgi:nitroreductase